MVDPSAPSVTDFPSLAVLRRISSVLPRAGYRIELLGLGGAALLLAALSIHQLGQYSFSELLDELGARFEPGEARESGAKVTVVLMTPRE